MIGPTESEATSVRVSQNGHDQHAGTPNPRISGVVVCHASELGATCNDSCSEVTHSFRKSVTSLLPRFQRRLLGIHAPRTYLNDLI